MPARAHENGKHYLRGRFVPTAKNGLAKNYYPEHGFIETDDMHTRAANNALPVPAHIVLETEPAKTL